MNNSEFPEEVKLMKVTTTLKTNDPAKSKN